VAGTKYINNLKTYESEIEIKHLEASDRERERGWDGMDWIDLAQDRD
jgi:hypothetical protein